MTDSRGYISIPGLKPGTYTVTQVSTKDGYLIDNSLHNVVIKDNGTYTLDIYNPPMGNLVIRKVDKVTKDPLQGVTFKVTTTGGALVANNGGATSTNGVYTTNASGEIRINKLQPGSYTVTEIETIPGYAKDAPAQTVDVMAGDTQTLTFEDTPLGGLLVKTMNAVTGEPLNDVTFKITTLDGTVIGTTNGEFTTDGYGNISITDLQSGGYIVTMIRVKDGFVLDSAPRTIDLKNHETYTLEYRIQPKGGLVIHTVDSLTKEPLQGAKFEVTNSAGKLIGVNNDSKTSDGLYTSSASGNIYLNTLQPGTYVVKQIATVSGYTIDSIPQTVLVKAGDVQTLTFENAPGGTLVVRALDSITKAPLSDVGFEVKGYTSANYPAGSHTTDASGLFRVDGVPTGTYTVSLVKLKDGYYIDETVQTIQVNAAESKELVFELAPLSGLVIKVLDAATRVPIEQSTVKVTTSDGTVVGTTNGEFTTNADGTITIPGLSVGAYIVKQLSVKTGYILNETAQTVEIKDSKSHTVEILNQTRGGILIRRIDAVTKLPVSGISFKVTTSTGELVGTNGGVTTSNGIFITDANGEILLNMLTAGAYIVTDRRLVSGVWVDVSSQTVHVGANDTQTLTFTSADSSTATDGDNAGTVSTAIGGLVIRVIDGKTRQPVKNATFKITTVNGAIIKDRVETDVNGLITLTDIVAGAYVITETQAPDGYTLPTQSTTVIVKGGTPTEVTITIGQALGIQIRDVVKGAQTPLGNCQFEVTKVNGEIVGRYTTDSSGLATVGSLEDGVYVVKQISCPEAYKLCDGSQNVIVKSGSLSTITFENEQHSGIRIKNIDAQTKKGIYHAHFLIRDASGALLGEVVTDQDGYAELDSLVTGGKSMSKILVTMIEAGEGYVLDKTERTLRINLGQVTEMVIESVPILGQIQITVKASALNTITGQVKESLLSGAVFEIINADTNRVVDTITSNASGIAATNPLPLGRYYISQTGAPKFFQINRRKVEAKLKVKGDVVSVVMYNAPATIRTAVTQKAPQRVSPTETIRYDITNVCNQANVSLNNFFWHDRIPTDAGRVGTITTGTYNARAWYKITYKTNQNDYRTLADNLLSTNEYTYKIDAGSLKLTKGEYVTDVRYEFGTVPAGFKMVKAAYIYVTVPSYMRIGYGIINRVDAGGSYQGEWDSSTAAVTTTIVAPSVPTQAIPNPSTSKLPQTGY